MKASKVSNELVLLDGEKCRRVWLGGDIEIEINLDVNGYNWNDCTFLRLSDYVVMVVNSNDNCEVISDGFQS